MWAHVDSWGSKAVVYANPPDPEMLIWRRVLHRGSLFVDVGANVGAYALWALDMGAEVVAVEPDPSACARLRENLNLNGYDAEVIEAALVDRPGPVRLSQGSDTMNRLVESGIEVAGRTLDDVLAGRYAAGVKVDVEGFERLVLEGAAQSLAEQRIGLLQLEWNDLCEQALGESRTPIVQLLQRFGYSVVRDADTSVDGNDYGRDVFAAPRPTNTSG